MLLFVSQCTLGEIALLCVITATMTYCHSVSLALDHGEVRHFHVPVLLASSLHDSRHAVAELEVSVRHIGGQHEPEVGICAVLERAGDHHRSLAETLHLAFRLVLVRAPHLDDPAATSTPPWPLDEPVARDGRTSPALVGEEQHATRVAVVLQDGPAAVAAAFVVVELYHRSGRVPAG